MPNVIDAQDKFAAPVKSTVEIIDILTITTLLDKLHIGGVLNRNAYCLGWILTALMQGEDSYIVECSHYRAHTTAVILNGEPHSHHVSMEQVDFIRAMHDLQYYIGIFSHHKVANLKRLKDRWSHFTYKDGAIGSELIRLDSQMPVYFQFRPELVPDLIVETEELILKEMYLRKFVEVLIPG